ncbi:hypothetical protein A3F02_01215 [Candidatus Curtissbacteria bacterium RIFCSPHIGHO2_12_FULL_38_9b]|uniref:Glycosyltransferase RgtA/B/C/D-like domain-containing protein n=2 Tax=Candidatus Curtissiibacteriota TaxID=1752717 RepID=A0A1F5GT84_9BACT|nr:MAG: hypothetical protein A3A48_03045 [Candidatus Curtissbacteria bacterium RIFCSPLOWO2_01_FULL_37_9]OGD95045.1 MAG: hypothetical protein A3F02_01215 [Candidatus Curtissbacteria bacterium RIFCSPHIGHO2_12_FULL_38_9b]
MNKTKELLRIILFEKTWILILLLAIILRVVLLFLLPVGQTPDEIFVFKRVWSEAIHIEENSKYYSNNIYFYPPLYFLIAGLIIRVSGAIPSAFDQAFSFFYIHLRILSMTLSIASLFIIWKILEKIELNNNIRLAIFGFIALLPSFVSSSVSVNHNNLLLFFVFIFIYLAFTANYQLRDYKKAAILGFIAGLSLLTKMDAIVLLPSLLIYVALAKNKKGLFKFITIFLMFALIAGGWWYIWNFMHTGWFYPRDLAEASGIGFAKPFAFSNYLANVFLNTTFTFFAVYGVYNNIFIGLFAYQVFMAIFILSGIGIIIFLFKKALAIFKKAYLVHSLIFLMNLLIFLNFNLFYVFQPQGRYFFPSIIFISLGFVGGFSYWFKGKSLIFLPAFLIIALLFFNFWGIGCVTHYFYNVNFLPSIMGCLS